MVRQYSSVPAPPCGLWFPPRHSYLRGETVLCLQEWALPANNPSGRVVQRSARRDRSKHGHTEGEEKPAKQNVVAFAWDALQPFPAGAGRNVRFPGKSKDIALTTRTRRTQLWAQGRSPSLGFYNPIPLIKKCFPESKKRLRNPIS